jgi:hypothetical protein
MSSTIVNLTQHAASPEQIAAGVRDLPGDYRQRLIELLTVDELPDGEEIQFRAQAIAELACRNGLGGDMDEDPPCYIAMIGGAPWLMSSLESALRERTIQPVYSFTRRESSEQAMPDGSVRKTAVFRHIGFVTAPKVHTTG